MFKRIINSKVLYVMVTDVGEKISEKILIYLMINVLPFTFTCCTVLKIKGINSLRIFIFAEFRNVGNLYKSFLTSNDFIVNYEKNTKL